MATFLFTLFAFLDNIRSMNTIFWLFSVLFLVSCASKSPAPKITKSHNSGVLFSDQERENSVSDPEFDTFIKRFKKYKNVLDKEYRPKDVTIVFGDEFSEEYLSTTTAACIYYNNGKREIRVNESIWDELGVNQKEFTVYHYMVHCDLDQHNHNNHKSRGIPVSTVSQTHVNETTLKLNRAHYLKDIFKNH